MDSGTARCCQRRRAKPSQTAPAASPKNGPNKATRFGGLEVTLRVKRVWKGAPQEEIKVHTAGRSAACGYGDILRVAAVRVLAQHLAMRTELLMTGGAIGTVAARE